MTKQTCEKCGATLAAPDAPCRRCLMELAASWKPEPGAEPLTTGKPRPGTPPPLPAELAPLFPELEIESLLGAGGMGAVYKARQKRLGRSVALKVLHGELSGDPMFVERFLREAQALAKLAHPGIVAVHDFGEREQRCYLVMEYVDGASLRALLKPGLLAPRQALDIVRQLCDALQFAHDEGVVHRDIKPENVLVDRAGRVKIADFGLAKLLGAPAQEALTSAGQVMGTPHYMAPEQVEHPRDVDHRADLFSLGVVFYEMLTGELPLGRFQPPSQRVQVDVRLDEIVLKTLARERERRYQQAVQVKTDVERVEREPGRVGDPRPGPFLEYEIGVGRSPGRLRRHRGLLRSGVYLPRLQALLGKHRLTAWGWMFVLVLAWIYGGLTFNGGPGWFWLTAVPLLTWLFVAMVATRTDAETPPDEELGRWVTRYGPGAFLLAALGIAALFAAHVSFWERWTWDYVSSAQHPLAGLERWHGAEVELLRAASIPLDAQPDVDVGELRLQVESSHSLSNPYVVIGLHPALLGLLACVALTASALLTARASRRPAREWRGGVVSSLALFLSSLVGLDFLGFALQGGTQRLEAVQVTERCSGEAYAVGQRLYSALVARELEVHAEHSAQIVERRSGNGLASVQLLAAGQSSIFERWRMTWSGPERVQPHVLFTLVSGGEEQFVILADGGLVAPEGLALDEWTRELEELLRSACVGS